MRDYKNYEARSSDKWELIYWCLLGIFVLTIFLHVLDEEGFAEIYGKPFNNPGRAASMLNLSQRIQILFLHNGVTLQKLMLAACVAGFLVAGMVLAHANEDTAPTTHSERFPLVVMKITEEPDGWVTTEQRSGQVCTYSPAAIATLDEWRDEMRYLPKGVDEHR